MHQADIINDHCKSNKLTCCLSNASECLNKYHYYLYNILTDEMIEIKCSFEDLQALVTTLINEKTKNILNAQMMSLFNVACKSRGRDTLRHTKSRSRDTLRPSKSRSKSRARGKSRKRTR